MTTDDLDELTDDALRLRALPLMGWHPCPPDASGDVLWQGERGRLYVEEFDHSDLVPDPVRDVADAVALVEAVRARGWWVNLESPCAWGGKAGKLWRAFAGRTECSATDTSAGADTPARALTILALRAHAKDHA